jgi:2',3'-cyclic-nucleotide 2'-phosphodiesterase (5'-nucleotidase family)
MRRLFPLLLILLVAGCYPATSPETPVVSPQPTVPTKPINLTVVHTNDTWGYLLPCG